MSLSQVQFRPPPSAYISTPHPAATPVSSEIPVGKNFAVNTGKAYQHAEAPETPFAHMTGTSGSLATLFSAKGGPKPLAVGSSSAGYTGRSVAFAAGG